MFIMIERHCSSLSYALEVRTVIDGELTVETILNSGKARTFHSGERRRISSGASRIASMSTEQNLTVVRGLGSIKHDNYGLMIARGHLLDEVPGLAFGIVTLVYLLSFLSGLL